MCPVSVRVDGWYSAAACFGMEELFVPTNERLAGLEARAVCASCPVRPQCLQAALDEEGDDDAIFRAGIRGGLNPKQRAALRRRP